MNKYNKEEFNKVEFVEVWWMGFAIVLCKWDRGTNDMRYDYADFYIHEFPEFIDKKPKTEIDTTHVDHIEVNNWESTAYIYSWWEFMWLTLGKYPFMHVDRGESQSLVPYIPALMRICRELYEWLEWGKNDPDFGYREFYY